MLAPVRISPPVERVVSLDAAKLHLRVDFADDDGVISALIDAAIDHLDGWGGILGRALVTQEWRQDFGGFYVCDKLRLPLVPITEDPAITYYDGDDAEQALSADVWQVLTDALGPYVTLKSGQCWPTVYSRPDAVSVAFKAGYGDAVDVPQALRVAILTHVKMHYDPSSHDVLKPMFEALVGPYRRINL